MPEHSTARIEYRRPPDRLEVFHQRIVSRSDAVIVTFVDRTPEREPLLVAGRPVLESGAPIVWFTFPGAWHDIGRFHLADGRPTGCYTNVLTPVRFLDADAWETTDLFLDVWQDGRGGATLLDEEEFRDATMRGWLDPELAARARAEADRVLVAAESGRWPPGVVWEWPVDRVRRELGIE